MKHLLILALAASAFGQTAVNGSRTIVGAVNYCADAGSTDAYACNLSPAITAYVPGACYLIKANTANTGAASLALNGLSAIPIKLQGADPANNTIVANQMVQMCYDGTNMQLQSAAPSAGGGGGTTYTAGVGVIISGNVISLDGSVVGSVFQAAADLSFGSIAANTCSYLTMSVPNALQGEMAVVNAPTLEDGLSPSVRISANNTARVGLCNPTASSKTAANQSFRVAVIRSF